MPTPIIIPLAPGFEETEFAATLDILRRLGFEVLIAAVPATGSPAAGREVTGSHGLTVVADATLAELQQDGRAAAPLAVVLPGGLPGAHHLRDSAAVKALLQRNCAEGRLVAAICAAPLALHAAGLLAGRKFTCYPGVEGQIQGGTHTGTRTELDGRVLTGKGPGTALEFGLAVGTALGKGAEAEKLRVAMIA